MIKNYLKVALRNLVKNRASSIINIGGLAVGMAVAILIGLWIWDELSFNKYHQSYDKIVRVMQKETANGTIYTERAMPIPLEKELQNKYGSDFKYLVLSSWNNDHILTLTTGNKSISKAGSYMGKDAARMLTLKMLKGDYNGLKDPNSILLSASTAKALFGDTDPMLQMLKVDAKLNVKITGVYEDLPYNSEFKNLALIMPWDLYLTAEPWVKRANDEHQWGNNSFQFFAQLAGSSSLANVNKKIIYAKQNNVPADEKKYKYEIFLHPMREWHLRSHWENGKQTGGAIEYVRLFTIVGIFVLLLACINFMNLSTARSEKRAKEVGIRKAVGSVRSQLIAQFYSESLLVVAAAFVLSLVLVLLILPWFNNVAGKQMILPLANPLFWLTGIGFALLSALVAGSYPALYLSSFKPVKVLKGTFRAGRFAAIPRKALVVVQFTVSLALIIGTVVVYNQVQFTKDRPIGYNGDGIMMVQKKSSDAEGKFDLFNTELKKTGAVTEFAESSSPLTDVYSNNGGFFWEGKDPNLDTDFGTIWVTYDFGKTVGWQFVAGRDFSKALATDSASIVLNEAAVKFMHLKNPIGTSVTWGTGKNARAYTVIGVIKDMLMSSPYEPVKQSIFFHDKDNEWMIMRLNPKQSAATSIAAIEGVFKKLVPAAPFDYKFADTDFANKFAAEERIGKLSTFFSVLAILISCLGLFGLASFTAEQRTKEIGVRKVLGASVINLWRLLCKDFVVLVIISCVIASPLAYFYLHGWLQKYTYRTDISWWVFVAAAAGALLITLLTVSFQSIKAALMNPVKSLRSE